MSRGGSSATVAKLGDIAIHYIRIQPEYSDDDYNVRGPIASLDGCPDGLAKFVACVLWIDSRSTS